MKPTLTPCLFAATLLLAASDPTLGQRTENDHDRDPWVFRCVLDDNARSLVISLGQRVWVAYDTTSCDIQKFWVGDVELSGAVYDARHGPQPKATGTILLNPPAVARDSVRYRGYRITDGDVTILYDHGNWQIEETVTARLDEQQHPVLVRTFVCSANETTSPLELRVPTSSETSAVRRYENGVWTDVPFQAKQVVRLSVKLPSSVTVEAVFSGPQ